MAITEIRLDLDEDAVEEVSKLASSADRLAQIISLSSDMQPQVGTIKLSRQLAQRMNLDISEVRALVTALLNFHRTQGRLKLDSAATADAIEQNLSKTDAGKKRLPLWQEAKAKIVGAIAGLNSEHPLIASAKALQVATSRQYDLVDMRIFTDARPVFNDAGTRVIHTVISHVLSLDYHDCHDHRILQLTMDAGDLIELKELCERATKKANILKNDLERAGWSVSIFREPESNPGTPQ